METQGDAAARKKQPRQQLSRGMEHLRSAVTLPNEPANSGLTTSAPLPPPQPDEEPAAYGVPSHYQPVRHPPSTTASHDPQKRHDPFQFGSRLLSEGDDIFAHNAWDHVEVDADYQSFISAQIELQRSSPVTEFDAKRFNAAPEKWWDRFYGNNRDNFFKDRKWLGQEFPLLREVTKAGYGRCTVLEVGAGAGNTAFPIVGMNENLELRVHACDYSKKAVEVMRASEEYDERAMRADVWDVTAEGEGSLPPELEEGSVDVVIMIFIFSALAPSQWDAALRNIWRVLRPGGSVLFRDYGRGDLAQVRFKKGRYLEENFYVRGDGTRVYFFDEDELRRIWSGDMTATARADATEDLSERLKSAKLDHEHGETAFEVVNLGVDRRMLVNRQRRLKMYRCWMQGLFKKPISTTDAG